MQDTLMEMSRSPLARQMLKRIGINPPPQLIRSFRPWSDALLAGKHILLRAEEPTRTLLAEGLAQQKASVNLSARAAGAADLEVPGAVYQATLFDTQHLTRLEDLKELYRFFRGLKGHLGFNHRVVILIGEGLSPEAKAITAAILGFTRSLAREFGPKGINVNALRLPEGQKLESAHLPIIHFFLSDFCAFVTGQILTLEAAPEAFEMPRLAGSLAGKTALVTGGAQGIGYAICQRLAEEGAHVIILDRAENELPMQELARSIDGEYMIATLGRDNETLIEKLAARRGTIDILVHNAGVTRDRTLFGMREQEWDDVLAINLGAVIDLTTKVLHRGMLAKGGRILCMSSVVGIAGNFGQTNYAASKGGLIGFVQGIAKHLAHEQATANAIAPGFIETSMTARIPFVTKQFARRLSSLAQGGQPDDVAEAVAFLASPCSQTINGQVLRVCGGSFMGA